jgi:hypothetical protein
MNPQKWATDELKWTMKQAIAAYFETLPWHLSWATEEKHEKSQSKFELWPPEYAAGVLSTGPWRSVAMATTGMKINEHQRSYCETA